MSLCCANPRTQSAPEAQEGSKGIRTTERESLNRCEPAEKALYWGLGSWWTNWRPTRGTEKSLEAIAGDE